MNIRFELLSDALIFRCIYLRQAHNITFQKSNSGLPYHRLAHLLICWAKAYNTVYKTYKQHLRLIQYHYHSWEFQSHSCEKWLCSTKRLLKISRCRTHMHTMVKILLGCPQHSQTNQSKWTYAIFEYGNKLEISSICASSEQHLTFKSALKLIKH